MKRFSIRSLPLLVLAGILVYSFALQNPYFLITEKDVDTKTPSHFPKPLYSFKQNKPSPAGFILGRKLFYDNILSKDNTVNCGTCHQRIAAFAHIDHALSHGIYAKIGTRNVPPLQNLVWKDAYMWDGRVKNLELQPVNPITSPIEMDESMENVVNKLTREAEYRALFFKAFKDSTITQQGILKALAQFTGLMISSNSRYDKYVNKTDTFSAAEKKGLVLFRQKCERCHKEPLFTDNAYRSNGLLPDTSLNDKGRGSITKKESENYTFKVPSLRNIEMTYPYMHDGRYRNLQSVLAHYAGSQITGPLTQEQQKEIIVFLKTLTDKTFLYDRRFVDPALEKGY